MFYKMQCINKKCYGYHVPVVVMTGPREFRERWGRYQTCLACDETLNFISQHTRLPEEGEDETSQEEGPVEVRS